MKPTLIIAPHITIASKAKMLGISRVSLWRALKAVNT